MAHPALLRSFHRPGFPLELISAGDRDSGEPGIRVDRGGRCGDLRNVTSGVRATDGGSTLFGFDPEALIDELTSERHFSRGRPLHSFLPFGFGWLPAPVRRSLFRIHAARKLKEPGAFPRWPIEPCVEDLRRTVWEAAVRAGSSVQPEPFWPDSAAYAVVLSHDVDSAESWRSGRWRVLAEMEEARGFRSSWHFCSDHLPEAEDSLAELSGRGHEIAWHGPRHDYRFAYRTPEDIRGIVRRHLPHLSRHGVSGFRSPFYLRTPELVEGLSGSFSYDSSSRDTAPELFSPHRREGCCTVFPFFRGGVLEMPITIPEDHYVSCLTGDDAEAIHRVQAEKLEWIASVGGMALVLTHPEEWISLRPGAAAAYRMFLDRLTKDGGARVMLARDAAEWWRKRSG